MDEAVIKRIMPHSTEAERAVIGAILMNKEAAVTTSEMITGEDFYQAAYGIVFDAMVELFHMGRPIDLITLQEHLKSKNVPPEISSLEFIKDLIAEMGVETSANVKYYAQIVQEKSTLRRLIKINEEIANTCYQENQPLEEILERTEKQVFELIEHGNSQEYVPIRQVVLNALDVIERASKTKGTVTGIPTGFIDLDYKLSGLQRSDLILIAARPSMGKTAFVLNIAQHVAFRQNLAVAIFSLEMSKEQLVNRLFSLESHVDAQVLRTGNLKDTDWEKLIEGAGTIGKSRMIIDDTSGISIAEMRSKCRKYKLELGLDLIIIDYLQLMSGSGGRGNESRQQEISEISRSLKGLARELNVPVIALSQLSRAVESRTDKRPMLSDLRESGAIEQDADVCMFIYREDYYIPDTEDKNIAEIIIAKQRNGPIGTVRLAWMPQYTRFGNELREQNQE
ncbi:replicative DNA helicase [Mediterraneibacter agrestimuris]|uniref:replicative DNA helicase n=1 Tax=Mediterraneibacter agrestimuris TaxID=2941333 RepID=UPI00203ED5F5|nr:replicative DNA helicase [Mediterraneibacter agrestimuris]